MLSVSNCPSCGKAFSVEVPPGTPVRCPHCQQVVTVPMPAAPPMTPASATPINYVPFLEPPKEQGAAIGALVCGLLGLFACPLVGLPGLILGIVGVRNVNREPNRYKGKGLAIGGIITGGLSLLSIPVYIFAFIALWQLAKRENCTDNLRNLSKAMRAYAGDWDGAFPPDFETLISTGDATEDNFLCLGSFPVSDLYACYLYVADQTSDADPKRVLIYEKPECHGGEGGNVLYVDGKVEFVSAERMADLVEKTESALKRRGRVEPADDDADPSHDDDAPADEDGD